MDDTPKLSGSDLARQAFANARKAARTSPTGPSARTRAQRTIRRGSGRDPVTLGSTLGRVSAEQGWEVSLGGGDVLERWAALCPQFADTVRPEGFDAEKGTLILRPTSYAYAAQLRLLGGQLAKQINDKLGRSLVARIRILPVGATTSSPTPTHAEAEPTPTDPPHREPRRAQPPGYLQAREAVQANRPQTSERDPLLQAAADRQTAVLAAPDNREPAQYFTDAVAELERLTPPEVDAAEMSRQAAIARKHAGDQPVRRAFDVA